MKKMLTFIVLMLMSFTMISAQTFVETNEKEVKVKNSTRAKEATSEGTITVGLNTTSLGFTNIKGNTQINAGLSVGAFAKDGFAVVGELSYTTNNFGVKNANDWNYGIGAKYYMFDVFPIQVDWNGSKGSTYNPGTSFVGFQGGFAWFPTPRFSVEPSVRYNKSTKPEYEDVLSGKLSFNVFF